MTLRQPQQPLQRLHVNDGLLITADRWQSAHCYHQHRHTIHYQALNRGGIVEGLGLCIADVPDTAPSKYRHPRWLTIHPGLAIDAAGNPIVVPNPEACYLSANPSEPTTIYIVLKHSEGESRTTTDIVQDAFQIIEKDTPAEADEVELCRVRLTPGMNAIAPPTNVFAPAANQLDLRHRQFVQGRSPLLCRVASWARNPMELESFEALFAALPTLYPMLDGQLIDSPGQSELSYLTYSEFCQLDRSGHHQLTTYQLQGGVLLLEADVNVDVLLDLYQAEADLEEAIAGQAHQASSTTLNTAQTELESVQACITDAIATLVRPIQAFCETEGLSQLADFTNLIAQGKSSPARLQPFQFSRLPTIHHRPIGLYGWGGILLLVGPLLQTWRGSQSLSIKRDELRTSQELGVNILAFAARHRQMHQWLTPDMPSDQFNPPSASEASSA
ncbi:MAG: hypothetical protein AB4042_18645 [Leptolyngbyaceae cyanobacterium]